MELQNKILKIRQEKELTPEQFANTLNVTKQTVSKWELGKAKPKLKYLKLITKIYSINLQNLIE